MENLCKKLLEIQVQLKSIWPFYNRDIHKLFDSTKGAQRYHLVNRYEKFWNKLSIIKRIMDKLFFIAEKKIKTDEKFKVEMGFDTYDDFTFVLYDAIKQELYTLVSLFISYKSKKLRKSERYYRDKYIKKYPELMYVYYLRNKMIQHPQFDTPFYGLASIPDYSYFEQLEKYYSNLLQNDETDIEIQNKNKNYFMAEMGRNWPSVNTRNIKSNKENHLAYLRLKAYNLPNPNWNNLGSNIYEFFNDIVLPFLEKEIEFGIKDDLCTRM